MPSLIASPCSQPWSCLQNAERLDSEIIYNRDFDYDYFGFKVRGRSPIWLWSEHGWNPSKGHVDGAQTLERSYLLRINDTVVERPQHMLMRVAIGIHKQVRQKRSHGFAPQDSPALSVCSRQNLT